MKGTGIGHRVLAALVVALGAGVIWGLLAVWVGTLTESLWQDGDQVYENITIARDGTPIIQSYSRANYQVISYRTLDGKPLSIDREDWLQGAQLLEPRKPPGLFFEPIAWRSRIIGASDYLRPAGDWYLIRDDEPYGHAYLAGFDDFSRQPIGFIGRQGFRSAFPPRDQWFDLGLHALGWGSATVCSTSYLNHGGRAYNYGSASDEQRLPEWLLFVIDGDHVLEIDLRSRAIRTLFESPDLVAVSILSEIQSEQPADDSADDTGAAASKTVRAQTVAHQYSGTFRAYDRVSAVLLPASGPSAKKVKVENRLAIRTLDRIVVLDPPTGAKQEFTIPDEWQQKSLTAYGLSDRQLLVTQLDWGPRYDVHLKWLSADGQVIRERTETLTGYGETNPRTGAMLASLGAPVPLGWYAMATTFVPLGMVQENKDPTYAAGLARTLDMVWPALVFVTILGFVFAWLVARWQRKYRRAGTAVWCTLVFLTGLPGLLAYWLEHHRAKLETCVHCGAATPRDRDACAACDTSFPAPPLVGTEIFA